MEIKLLLLRAIGVVYYASYAQTSKDSIPVLVERVMEHLTLPDDPDASNRERGALLKLRAVLIWMTNKGCDEPYDLQDLMTRIRLAVGDNDRLYDLFCASLKLVDDPDAAEDKMRDISGELYEFIAIEDMSDLLRKSSRRLSFEREKIDDVQAWKNELVLKIQSLDLGGKRRASTIARCIDFSDASSVAEVFRMAQTALNPDAILKKPLKALNRMTGEQDGARRGEWSNVSALPGQNKSGQLLDEFISMCIFNKPKLFDETKKPMHIYTTIEDKIELVFQKLYVLLMQQEHNRPIVVRGADPEEMATYVMERLQRNGWHVQILQFPNGGHSDDYIAILKDFQDQGFEIVSAGCDYVNLIGKQGIPAQVAGDEVQMLHRKIRSFTAVNDIYHYTAHQLSTDAKTLARQFPDDYIKKLPGKGYYEGCKKLDTEFDYEYLVAKTFKDGITWQEFQWGKHRKMGATQESDKYFAVKFHNQVGMIGYAWDVELDIDLSYKKVGARSTAAEGGYDYRDFDE